MLRMAIQRNGAPPLAVRQSSQHPATALQREDRPGYRILSAQKTFGNQAVRRSLEANLLQRKCASCVDEEKTDGSMQTKLAINGPGDTYEREADRVADAMMSEGMSPTPIQPGVRSSSMVRGNGNAGGQKCEKCKGAAAHTGHGGLGAPASVDHVLDSAGEPMQPGLRSFMERRFNAGFEHVRVHAEDRASESAQAVNALAYTVGHHVVFGRGQYAPESPSGRRLIAHELTHVLQQSGTPGLTHAQRSLQPKLIYIGQVEEEDATKCLAKFDEALQKVDKTLAPVQGPEAEELRNANARLHQLRSAGKVTCWQTTGEVAYASWHHLSGELRIHVYFLNRLSPDRLIHEATHSIHALNFPKLSHMYGEAFESSKEIKPESDLILLLKWKAWTEYWAEYRAAEYYNLLQTPERKIKPEDRAKDYVGVTKTLSLLKGLGVDFDPATWTPPKKIPTKKTEKKSAATPKPQDPASGKTGPGTGVHKRELQPSPLQEADELEAGHTDCDWDRNVGKYEVFKPRSSKAVSKVQTDECTKPCTQAHEDLHKKQLEPVCKSYYDCYVEAGKRVAGECKDNKECKELRTLELLLDCFEKLASAWNARWWECEAYKASLVCAQKLQQKSDNKCSGKIGAYLYSAQQSIKKYCEPEKSPSSAPGKPSVGEKAKPDKPDAPLKELFQQRTEPCSSTERQSDVLEVR